MPIGRHVTTVRYGMLVSYNETFIIIQIVSQNDNVLLHWYFFENSWNRQRMPNNNNNNNHSSIFSIFISVVSVTGIYVRGDRLALPDVHVVCSGLPNLAVQTYRRSYQPYIIIVN